ncbi:hypothetical protein [uncultured Halomonas sp.]|uniref:hypothetical protein n=1 Tax=uncultured Halomonas sp. TaxID=173971 RepID=UPI00261D85EE|nr:hypothetical protein [uncultured Halomonas sp.]
MPGLLEQQPMPLQGEPIPDETMPPEGEQFVSEDDPAFQAAVQLTHDALYKEGAADNIHNILAQGDASAEQIADIAYEITSIADERTEGMVPDELLVLLAANSLNEVADIAIASGAQLRPEDLAQAMEQMILRFVGEMGHDTRELQAAMDAIPKEQFGAMADTPEEAMPADPMMQEV